MEDRMIKFTKAEVMLALEEYYNNHMRRLSQPELSVKKLEVARNRSTKYLCRFTVGGSK